MANSWLRLWHDMPNDPKWRTISRVSKQPISSVIAVYIHLLVIASNANERGRTHEACSEDIASALDLECEQIDLIISAMQGRVLDGDQLKGWEKRQVSREDGSAERAKAWREAKKEEKRTQTNANERKQTPDKDKDKYKDKDKEEDKESVESAHTPDKKSPSPGHKKTKSQITFDYSTIETPDFIDRGLWLEWLNARKDQHPKASQSEIAIKAHLKTLCEIESEGMSANAALVIAIKGGADGCWIGIETEWIRNRLQKSETRVTGYQATEKPAIRDFVQERTQNAIDEGKRRMMERKANESAIVLPATEFVTLQQRAV